MFCYCQSYEILLCVFNLATNFLHIVLHNNGTILVEQYSEVVLVF